MEVQDGKKGTNSTEEKEETFRRGGGHVKLPVVRRLARLGRKLWTVPPAILTIGFGFIPHGLPTGTTNFLPPGL